MSEYADQTLFKLKSLNFDDVDNATLIDIKQVSIDTNMSIQERVRSFIDQIHNPYMYKHGKTIVKISFSNTEATLEDKLINYFASL